ncbi:MAG: type II secretion system protein GspD [Tenacibaculum sp.]
MQKKYFIIILLTAVLYKGFSQHNLEKEKQRIQKLEQQLNSLQNHVLGLSKTVDFNVSMQELPVFIKTVGKLGKVNISVSPELQSIVLTHNFSKVSIKDILIYLCKEHKLSFNITGNIISLKKHKPKQTVKKAFIPKQIPVVYNKSNDLFSVDLQNDTLSVAFKKITDVTGNNLVFSPGLGNKLISVYIKNKSFKSAMDKLAFSNNLLLTKTQDNYYLFESTLPFQYNTQINDSKNNTAQKPIPYRSANFYFKVIDIENQVLDVDFENTPILSVIKDIGAKLNINMFTSATLANIGTASVKANPITYNKLIAKILENTPYTYKKKNGIYYFGKQEQALLRSSVVVPLMHRSIEIMSEPLQSNQQNFNTNYSTGNIYNNNQPFTYGSSGVEYNQANSFNNKQNANRNNSSFAGNYSTKSEALLNIFPKDVVDNLDIKTDIEHNAFIVSGDAQKIVRFKEFIATIDKPVPVILIEVMILEVSKLVSISTGVDLGIGSEPAKSEGVLYPTADLTIGATAINKIIGGFDGFGSLNIGKVVPNFFAKIQLMEKNGDVKIRSTPKLSTLNGHQATLSNGERSYYKIERTDVIGSQNPQTIQTNNYVPIDANLTIEIRPIVSGDEQITLNINVSQSSFNGKSIDADAPPGMNSREFTSTIRVRDQDVIILGGLEEHIKNNSGSGVPFLARVPVIKWLFSKKIRTNSKTKLSVLIKPTIIR